MKYDLIAPLSTDVSLSSVSLSILSCPLSSPRKERKSFFSSHLSFLRFSLLFSLQPNNNGKVIRIQKLHGITTLYYLHRSKTLISTNCQSIPLIASQVRSIFFNVSINLSGFNRFISQ